MRLWRSRYAFGSIYAYGVRYRASHSICLLRKRGEVTSHIHQGKLSFICLANAHSPARFSLILLKKLVIIKI